MSQFELSDTVQRLALEAKESLSNEQPLPRVINTKGAKVGAKGSKFKWDDPHERMWDEASKDHGNIIKTWKGSPSIPIVRHVLKLEPGHSLKTPPGKRNIYLPIDGLTSKVHIRHAGGEVQYGLKWQPNLGYRLEADDAIKASKDSILFVLIELTLPTEDENEEEREANMEAEVDEI